MLEELWGEDQRHEQTEQDGDLDGRPSVDHDQHDGARDEAEADTRRGLHERDGKDGGLQE